MQKPPVNFKSHPGQWADGLATRTEHFFFDRDREGSVMLV
jgi:hypothetical protein